MSSTVQSVERVHLIRQTSAALAQWAPRIRSLQKGTMVRSAQRSHSTHLHAVSFPLICLVPISLLLGLSGASLASGGIQEDPTLEVLPSHTPISGIVNEQPEKRDRAPALDVTTWGLVTAPVHGTSLQGAYRGAELFAGPDQFGSYFTAVLPNGRVVRPAGVSTQVGMNPLGVALTLDGKYLITSNSDELYTAS